MSESPYSWVNNLSNSTIRADATAAMADGTMGYADVLQILTDVQNNGPVTAGEISDLKTIANNIDNLSTTAPYLSYVLNALVNGDPANASWYGGGATATALGNLAAGCSAAQLAQLTDKWLLGGDMPNPDLGGSSPDFTYTAQSAALYGAGGLPVIADINQGQTGDCFLLAALGEVALNDPAAITSMISDNGNNTYGVRFYVGGKPIFVTVNDQLPTSGGQLQYEQGNNDIWAGLVEKAYVQLRSSGVLGSPFDNSYASLAGGGDAGAALQQITNDPFTCYDSSSATWSGDKQLFITALTDKRDVVVASYGDTYDASGQQCFVNDHEFSVVGYDAATGKFILRNPWGASPGQTWETRFEAGMADIAAVNGAVDVSGSASPVVVTAVPRSVGPAAAIPLSALFTVSDANGAGMVSYEVTDPLGGGSIHLNGARNWSVSPGTYDISAADLAKMTYVGGAGAGFATLTISAYDGADWSAATAVGVTTTAYPVTVVPMPRTITLGESVAAAALFSASDGGGAALTAYRFQLTGGDGALHLDGAANLAPAPEQALGYVQVAAADLGKICIGAAGPGTESLSVSAYDGSWWSEPATVALTVVGTAGVAAVSAGLISVAAALSAFSAGQLGSAATVADSAAAVASNLDALQTLAAGGKLASIALTDPGIPVLTVTPAQLTADATVLHDISGNFTVEETASAPNVAITGLSGHANTVVFGGMASQYTITPAGDGSGFTVSDAGSTDHLSNISALRFADDTGIVASQTPAVAGAVSSAQVTELYGAVLGRIPDVAGLAYYETYAATHPATAFAQFAQWFLSSPEYTGNAAHTYAESPAGDTRFITDSYTNLLHRAPASTDAAWYESHVIDPLLAGVASGTAAYATAELRAHAQVLAYFSQSPEFLSDVTVTAQHPADAQHWLVLV